MAGTELTNHNTPGEGPDGRLRRTYAAPAESSDPLLSRFPYCHIAQARRIDAAEFQVHREIEDIQIAIWGMDTKEVTCRYTVQLLSERSGQIIGAFNPDGKLVGFSAAYLARDKKSGETYLHLDLLGVIPDCQSRAVGATIMQCAKENALAEGFTRIEWTFDPLESRNANLYLSKLGGRVVAFKENCYGTINDDLSKGLPSDRFLVRWDLSAPRVETQFPADLEIPAALELVKGGHPQVVSAALDGSTPYLRMAIPLDIQEIKRTDEEAASAWSASVREIVTRAFEKGYEISAFRVNPENGLGEYLFQKRSASQVE